MSTMYTARCPEREAYYDAGVYLSRMEQLSSCYFCGGALDASLAEYPIVPKSLQPDAETQGTVVLCSTCRQKLAAIVEPVVEVAESSAADADRERPRPDGRESDSGDGGESESPPGDGIVDPAADGTLLGNGDAAGESTRTATGVDESPAEGTDAPSGDAESGLGSGGDEPDTASDAQAAADAAEERDTEATEGADAATASDESAAERGPSLTKLEYNKVMRLLQNREMPVDRAEIREVAVNAYDIEPEQFDAIIDAAVERDLIGQSNGRLVESE